jgi:hypothetical protein
MSDKLEPPKPDAFDAAHSLIKGIVGTLPLGAFAVELFQWFISPSLERRRVKWTEEVANVLVDLQENRGVRLEDLQVNEQFIDVLLHASQVAVRTSQAEKITALRNAITNAALTENTDVSRQQMFLEFVDAFTAWHLKLLDLFDDPRAWAAKADHQFPAVAMGSLQQILVSAIPQVDQAFADVVWGDLNSHRLVHPDSLHGMMTASGLLERRTTSLGREFLSFVRRPR